mmetsp:Transcript_46899/g.101880  ORF Transcript_46899/g.101880 Transcript_46899/m.101880 type:complete len:283 (+) Transcript_46899:348-1196(+)
MSNPQLALNATRYIFINCPAVSRHEWHPFTISSAPDDYFVTIHIKILGDWTQKLETLLSPIRNPSFASRTMSARRTGTRVLRVDGPYGTPTEGYHTYQNVLFVGAGIGATPFVSILRSLKGHIEASEAHPSEVAHNTVEAGACRKIDFVVICPDEDAVVWFSDVLSSLSSFPSNFLRIQLFLTQFPDAQSRESFRESRSLAGTRDPITDLPRFESGMVPRLRFGRPDFDKVLENIQRKNRQSTDPVGVFFCGPRTAGLKLEQACIRATGQGHTPFEFHKEIF